MTTTTVKKIKENGRDRLIAASLKLFANKGFHACSIREICEEAKANISLVSFHFGGKEGLLDTILLELVEQDFSRLEAILVNPTSSEDVKIRLDLFLHEYVEFSIKHGDVISLYLEELERGNPQAVELQPKTYGKLWNALLTFFIEAQEKNLIDQSLNVEIVSFQILAPINHLIRSRRSSYRTTKLSLEDEEFRSKFLSQIVKAAF